MKNLQRLTKHVAYSLVLSVGCAWSVQSLAATTLANCPGGLGNITNPSYKLTANKAMTATDQQVTTTSAVPTSCNVTSGALPTGVTVGAASGVTTGTNY